MSATAQLPLFGRASDPCWLSSPTTELEKRFAEFHQINPHVYGQFERLALDAFERGARRIGVKAIAERIRWDVAVKTLGGEFKINNSLTALYARLLLHRHPKLWALIVTRSSKHGRDNYADVNHTGQGAVSRRAKPATSKERVALTNG